MKKQVKRLLTAGLCLALGLSVGCGLAACGGDDATKEGEKSNYYLAGASAGTLFDNAGDWDSTKTTIDEVPDEISFKTTKTANVYELTVELYKDDAFQVLIVGQAWSGQMGAEILDADRGDEDIVDTPSGGTNSNIKVNTEGKYTLTLTVADSGTVLTYERVGDATPLPVAVSGITLDVTTKTLKVGEELTLTATVAPTDAADKTVTWTSSDTTKATVANGKVTAVAVGEVTITAKAGEKTATCKVTIVSADAEIVDVTGVTLNKTTATIHAGTSETLVATVAPENATNKAVTYVSSDEDVVTVDNDGKITTVHPGTATITVTAEGGKTAECEVTVPTDYYLRGSVYQNWAVVKSVNAEGAIVFEETEPGIYKTASVELKKDAEFQIAVVAAVDVEGDEANSAWAGKINNSALATDASTVACLVASGTDNIKVVARGKYTITIDTTGSQPSVSCVLDEELEEEAAVLYICGNNYNNWGAVDTEAEVLDGCKFSCTESEGVLTYTLQRAFAVGDQFQILTVGNGWGGQIGTGSADKLASTGGTITIGSGNIEVTDAGIYELTLVINGANKTLTYRYVSES